MQKKDGGKSYRIKEGGAEMSLKEQRIAAGLSQSQLSRLSGVNLRSLQDYEQGKKNVNGAKLKTIFQLASALNCTVAEIINEDEELLELLKGVNNV